MIKILLIVAGTVSLMIGITGILIPGLPTTPFILLTAGLYVRSSDRLYHLIISNKQIRSFILKYRANKGMTRKLKIYSICAMWLMIIISCVFFIPTAAMKIIVSAIGITGTIVMGIIIPTVNNSK